MKTIKIGSKEIGPDFPPYVVAEVSANHNGDLQKALDTITAARECGADAVKLQTYTADTMTINSDKEEFRIQGGPWAGKKLYDLYKWAQTPFEWHQAMFEHANNIGITCFSTPFDETAVDLLEEMEVPAYKIASFEATDLPLIRYVASKGKPMIISTGMANWEEIQESVETAHEAGCSEIIVLHCISSYPAPIEQCNLRTITDLRERLGVQVGLSDHTLSNTAAITSVALGAAFIEKHFILDRRDKGPDSDFSIEPDELTTLCSEARNAWLALGAVGYDRKPAEEENSKFRRSIYFVADVKAGERVEQHHIRRIRPGYGLPPKYTDKLLGMRAKVDIPAGTAASWELVHG